MFQAFASEHDGTLVSIRQFFVYPLAARRTGKAVSDGSYR